MMNEAEKAAVWQELIEERVRLLEGRGWDDWERGVWHAAMALRVGVLVVLIHRSGSGCAVYRGNREDLSAADASVMCKLALRPSKLGELRFRFKRLRKRLERMGVPIDTTKGRAGTGLQVRIEIVETGQ